MIWQHVVFLPGKSFAPMLMLMRKLQNAKRLAVRIMNLDWIHEKTFSADDHHHHHHHHNLLTRHSTSAQRRFT